MLSSAGVSKTMNTLEHWLLLSILLCHMSLGRCGDATFSICWMGKAGALRRLNGNLWLNDTSVKSLGRAGKVTSLTVTPGVENKLTYGHGSSFEAWTFQITLKTKFTKIKGRKEPVRQPLRTTEGLLDTMTPAEPFACENGTLFFHQDKDFFLAFGYTTRLPIHLEARSSSMLRVAWNTPHALSRLNRVTLHHTEHDSLRVFHTGTTSYSAYRFRALRPCSTYAACVEKVYTEAYICITATTEPDVPTDIELTSWNSSSLSLAWGAPLSPKYSSFLLTVFHLNGTDHITQEFSLPKNKTDFEFTLSDLEPCSRVRFGLQAICKEGTETVYSKMSLNDGNSEFSSIGALQQKSFGPDNYALSWEVKNTSSISMFRVHHEEVLQATTLLTNYTVGALLPCKSYEAKVEALCGDGVLMSARTISTHTGPHGVSELRFRSNDSTAVWTPSIVDQPDLAFLYALSLQNGTTIESSRLNRTELELSMLEGGQSYILDVWEQCDGQWESEHSHVFFQQPNSSLDILRRTGGRDLTRDLQTNDSSQGLTLVVPWLLPEDLLENVSEARVTIEKIFQHKLQELLKDFEKTVQIELTAFEPVHELKQTKVLFTSFDSTQADEDLPLPARDQLDHIRTLKEANVTVTVTDGVIFWDGPDLCASSQMMSCPENSLCINTMDSYTCLCQLGYYDVSSVIKGAAAPVCNEKGLFSQCMDRLVTGGIAKPYLTSHLGGDVDVKLNDGQCSVDESETLYFFHTARKASECGTERRVNASHIEFQNTLTVTRTGEKSVNRRDLTVVWKCVYPRHYVRKAQVSVNTEWLSPLSLVELSTSRHLGLTLALYTNAGYNDTYKYAIYLEPEDTLFFQVDMNASFSADLLFRVESCWATESTDPQDPVQGLILQDGCPVDNTFQWHSVNGQSQKSRFSIQMFNMPKMLPLYVHCLTTICAPEEDCTKNCTNQQRVKRAVSRLHRKEKQAAVVSAGPLMVSGTGKTQDPASNWAEHMTVISIVAGAIGFLTVTALSVRATKALMTYYERLRHE